MSNAQPETKPKFTKSLTRPNILPRHFPGHFMLAEGMVYNFSDHLIEGYSGGQWQFWETENKNALFMMPDNEEEKMQLTVPTNHFSEEVSAQTAGIIVSLFAWNHVAIKYPTDNNISQYENLKYGILDCDQFETCLIMRAID